MYKIYNIIQNVKNYIRKQGFYFFRLLVFFDYALSHFKLQILNLSSNNSLDTLRACATSIEVFPISISLVITGISKSDEEISACFSSLFRFQKVESSER